MEFNLRTIGPEPAGASPIDPEDLEGLIPSWVATRADLNQVEFENIARALPWGRSRARKLGPEGVLEHQFLFKLHRRMFGEVWKWAGTQRRRGTNIGVAAAAIGPNLAIVLDDARYWHAQATYPVHQIAVRLHYRLVSIHPFPNGNGRATRLLADLYLTSIDRSPLTWGAARLDEDGRVRREYIAALQMAGNDDCEALTNFALS